MSANDYPQRKKANGGKPRRHMIVPVGEDRVGIVCLLSFRGFYAFIVFHQPWISALERWRIVAEYPVLGLCIAFSPLMVWFFMVPLGMRWIAPEAWLTIDDKGMTLWESR
jgi:hypothetical protein